MAALGELVPISSMLPSSWTDDRSLAPEIGRWDVAAISSKPLRASNLARIPSNPAITCAGSG